VKFSSDQDCSPVFGERIRRLPFKNERGRQQNSDVVMLLTTTAWRLVKEQVVVRPNGTYHVDRQSQGGDDDETAMFDLAT
jgi:hypothetical protein